jgi:PKD repeat protein
MKRIFIICFACLILQSCGKQPVADFTWEPENPKAGDEVHFTNLSKDAKRYSWNLGDMNISKETNPTHSYEEAGEYIIDLYAYKGLMSDLKTVTITVEP